MVVDAQACPPPCEIVQVSDDVQVVDPGVA